MFQVSRNQEETNMDILLDPQHPLRPVDWRYQRARNLLASGGHPNHPVGPELFKSLFRFLSRLVACQDEIAKEKLTNVFPELHLAFQLFLERPNSLAGIIEARLLAAEPLRAIAEKTGFAERVIAAYAGCFFDVASRLRRSDLIHCLVFDRSGQAGDEASERELALKRVAYQAGAEALDGLLNGSLHRTGAAGSESGLVALTDHLQDSLLEKIRSAIGHIRATDPTAIQRLARYYSDLHAVRRNYASSTSAEERYAENIKAMLDQIPWKLASKKPEPGFEKWHGLAAELRAHEKLLVSTGMGVPDERELHAYMVPADPHQPKRPGAQASPRRDKNA